MSKVREVTRVQDVLDNLRNIENIINIFKDLLYSLDHLANGAEDYESYKRDPNSIEEVKETITLSLNSYEDKRELILSSEVKNAKRKGRPPKKRLPQEGEGTNRGSNKPGDS